MGYKHVDRKKHLVDIFFSNFLFTSPGVGENNFLFLYYSKNSKNIFFYYIQNVI